MTADVEKGVLPQGSLVGVREKSAYPNATSRVIARLAGSGGVSDRPAVFATTRHAQARAAEHERRLAAHELHVVESIHFGRERRVTCAACDFVATGRSDAAMADAFWTHVKRAA